MIRASGSCSARAADSPCGSAMKISSASPRVAASVGWKFLPSNAGWPVRLGWIEVTGLPVLLPAVTAAISS